MVLDAPVGSSTWHFGLKKLCTLAKQGQMYAQVILGEALCLGEHGVPVDVDLGLLYLSVASRCVFGAAALGSVLADLGRLKEGLPFLKCGLWEDHCNFSIFTRLYITAACRRASQLARRRRPNKARKMLTSCKRLFKNRRARMSAEDRTKCETAIRESTTRLP